MPFWFFTALWYTYFMAMWYIFGIFPRFWDRCYDFLNIFAEKFRKKIAFLFKLLLVFAKTVTITLFFEKNVNFFAENCRKSQKIVIITSTPGMLHQEKRGNGTKTRKKNETTF
jgi:hypothetical protein